MAPRSSRGHAHQAATYRTRSGVYRDVLPWHVAPHADSRESVAPHRRTHPWGCCARKPRRWRGCCGRWACPRSACATRCALRSAKAHTAIPRRRSCTAARPVKQPFTVPRRWRRVVQAGEVRCLHLLAALLEDPGTVLPDVVAACGVTVHTLRTRVVATPWVQDARQAPAAAHGAGGIPPDLRGRRCAPVSPSAVPPNAIPGGVRRQLWRRAWIADPHGLAICTPLRLLAPGLLLTRYHSVSLCSLPGLTASTGSLDIWYTVHMYSIQ